MFSTRKLRKFYDGRSVLITGHTGFKGSWLTTLLTFLDAETTGYALPPPTEPSMFDSVQLSRNINSIRGDVRNFDRLSDVFASLRPSVVFHLAAQPIVIEGYENPRDTFDINVRGTVNILNAIAEVDSVESVVIVTSDKCYSVMEGQFSYRENDPLGGKDPYSASKACAEHVATAYRSLLSGSTAVVTARAGNIVGGGDWSPYRLIPDCVRSLSNGDAIELRSPSATRPWQYVLDALCGYLQLAKYVTENENTQMGWNFAPLNDKIMSVEEIVRYIVSEWGSGEYKLSDDSYPDEDDFLRLDSTKAMVKLDWEPVYDIKPALESTLDWYKAYYDVDTNIRKLTFEKVENYMRRGKVS